MLVTVDCICRWIEGGVSAPAAGTKRIAHDEATTATRQLMA